MKKKLTKAKIDKQILDHADEIIRLMELKGLDTKENDCEHIHIWLIEDCVSVEHVCQDVKTTTRKKK